MDLKNYLKGKLDNNQDLGTNRCIQKGIVFIDVCCLKVKSSVLIYVSMKV